MSKFENTSPEQYMDFLYNYTIFDKSPEQIASDLELDSEKSCMAKRRSRKREDEALGSLVVLAGFAVWYKPILLMPVILVTIAVVALYVYVKIRRANILRQSGIKDIDRMKGSEFEAYFGVLFRSLGYDAQVTQASGDFEADLILQKDDKRIVVQAKRYKNNVGINAVQQIVGAKKYYKADETWVVTNSHFTDAARKLASANRVVLIDREQLIQMSVQVNKGKLKKRA